MSVVIKPLKYLVGTVASKKEKFVKLKDSRKLSDLVSSAFLKLFDSLQKSLRLYNCQYGHISD